MSLHIQRRILTFWLWVSLPLCLRHLGSGNAPSQSLSIPILIDNNPQKRNIPFISHQNINPNIKKQCSYNPENQQVPWKSMVGRCISNWNSPFFLGNMLIFQGVSILRHQKTSPPKPNTGTSPLNWKVNWASQARQSASSSKVVPGSWIGKLILEAKKNHASCLQV